VAVDATPVQTAEAVKNASAEDMEKLGMRALRGVLAHEFSHVMDRHMLLNAIAGSISSGVAFAAYGVMWAVGHAQAAAKKLKDRLFPPQEKPEDIMKGGDGRVRLEPISAAVAVKSLPALLRLFAALWAPIVLQITQMASSRADEGMADADGAKLSNDPEALALALGLLTTWRPKTLGPVIPTERLPVVAANSHLFTVNPLEQMHKAGALPKSDALSDLVVGKQDDFLFNLFITHPDTTQRIERLYAMAQALEASNAGPIGLRAQNGPAHAAEEFMALDREVFGKMTDAAVKGVLATLLAAAAFFIHPVLTVGVGLVALAQYYRMVRFMLLHNKLQKAVEKAVLDGVR